MTPAAYRKNDDMDDLLALASDVGASEPSPAGVRSARDAARALLGIAAWVSQRADMLAMQRAMAELARYEAAWATAPLRALPVVNGYVNEHVAAIAVVASSLVPFFGSTALRSGMAFWATEHDSAVWQSLAAA